MIPFAAPGRYGSVLLMSIVVLALMIGLPSGDGGTAAVVLLEGALLVLVVETSEAPFGKQLKIGAGVVAILAAGSAILGVVPTWISVGLGGLMVLLTLGTLLRGALRMMRAQGVNAQLVCAGLAVYVVLGILFADIIGAVADGAPGSYFKQGTDGNTSDRVYFSFVTLTTTGYGDFTPATQIGKALAVCEVLIGEIYLLTVVSLLVGNLRPQGPREGGAVIGATGVQDSFPAGAGGGAAAGASGAAGARAVEPPLPPPD